MRLITHIEGFKDIENRTVVPSLLENKMCLLDPIVINPQHWLVARSTGFWSETNRAIRLSTGLFAAGAELPSSTDLVSVLMGDHGLWYLERVCAHFDISTIESLSPPSQWMMCCFFRTVRSCYDSIMRQIQGFPGQTQEYYSSPERLVHEINASPRALRLYFLLGMSVGGTVEMLQPLILNGIELEDDAVYLFHQALARTNVEMSFLLAKHVTALSPKTAKQMIKSLFNDGGARLLERCSTVLNSQSLERPMELVLDTVRCLSHYDEDDFTPEERLDCKAMKTNLGRIFATLIRLGSSKMPHRPNECSSDCNKIGRLIIESGLFRDSDIWEIDLKDPLCSPLMLAVFHENLSIVRRLLDDGCDVNEILPRTAPQWIRMYSPPTLLAIALGSPELVQILLDAGADVTQVSAMRRPAWEISALCKRSSHPRAVKAPSLVGNCNKRISQSLDDVIFKKICVNLDNVHGLTLEEARTNHNTRMDSLKYPWEHSKTSCM